MSEEKKASETEKAPTTFMDVVTGKIGKIVGLCTLVVALLTQVQKFRDLVFGPPQPHVESKTASPMSCFKDAKLLCPKVVPGGEWEKMDLRLTGHNECGQVLNLRVKFMTSSSVVRIEPPFAVGDSPPTWETSSVDNGEVKWKVTPPHLTFLGEKKTIPIEINWSVYTTEDDKLVRSGKEEISVQG